MKKQRKQKTSAGARNRSRAEKENKRKDRQKDKRKLSIVKKAERTARPRPIDEGDGGIFDVPVTPETVLSTAAPTAGLAPPPRYGEHIITMSMNHRSYTPPVLDKTPGGGGPMDYELFPGVVGQAVLKKDGSMWILSPEPNEEHARDDWDLIVRFLDVLHPRCRVVNCIWGELSLKLVDGGWVNRPEIVVDVRSSSAREIDVWWPPAEGEIRKGHVEERVSDRSS